MKENFGAFTSLHWIAAPAARNDGQQLNNRHCEERKRRGNPVQGSNNTQNKAFSLIELLICLIIISLIVASFAPIITKKMKYQNATMAGGIGGQNCKKFDPSGRCLACDKDRCTLCSTQIGLNKGQYVDPNVSCEVKTCAEGYSKCSDTAVSCLEGYGYDASTKKCTKCEAGTASKGENFACTPCTADSVSSAGASVCTECKAIEHKKPNAAKTACVNVTCSKGQYIENITCKTCPAGTYQEVDNHQQTSCLSCSDGFYCESGNKVACSDNCKTCSTADKCTKCDDGYIESNGKCIKGGGDCYTVAYSKICIAKFNAGDPGGLEIPEGLVTWKVTVASGASGGGQHTQAICWKGDNTSGCDAANGGYSGCNRTVCTWYAADKICKYHGWRLPTNDEMSSFLAYSQGKGTNGLQLCGYSPGYSSARCSVAARCPGSYNGYCYPYGVWSGQVSSSLVSYYYNLNAGVWYGPNTNYASYAFSVRCVRDL